MQADEPVAERDDELPVEAQGADEQRPSDEAVQVQPDAPATKPAPSRLRRVGTSLLQGVAVLVAIVVGVVVGRIGVDVPAAAPSGGEHDRAQVWTCSMHPQIRMSEPGQCPICGMDLVPADDVSSDEEHGPQPPRIELSPTARALAKVKTSPVVRTEPRSELRLLGRVDYDETRLRVVTPWTDGRIDRLKVRVTGAKVRRGQVVALLYSPEVYAAMRDLVVAVKQARKLSKGLHGAGNLAAAAVSAARERLRLLGVSQTQIASIEKSLKAPTHVPIRSTFGGTILERKVEQGDYVKAGAPLYHIADLTKVWVQIDAYESDLPHVGLGQTVVIEIESLPGERFTGTVAFIDPVVDRKTRTARVRVEVANKDGQLRPGMFAQAFVEADIGDKATHLVIPATASLFTGRRSVVYVAVPGKVGAYELREVRLGPRAGPVYPVLAGLSEGEEVVTRGAFALDADLQLGGGRSMMTLADDRVEDGGPAIVVTPQMLATLEPVVTQYVEAQEKLAADDFAAARKSLEALANSTNGVELTTPPSVAEAWKPIASKLVGHTRHAAMVTGEGEVRAAFEHVSVHVIELLRTFGNPTQHALRLAFCPMAFDSRGSEWVQRDGPIANPYYGEAMLRCGEFKAAVLPGERLPAVRVAGPPPPSGQMAGHQH